MSHSGTLLVERAEEIARLDAAIGRACAGEGQAISVRGTAGIGKTSLLRAATASGSERGMLALSASASELEQQFPFGLVRQLIEPVLANADESARARLLSGAARLAASAVGLDREAPAHADPSFGPLHGLYWLVANLCLDRPLLLAVDDAQWGDEASLRFLAYLSRSSTTCRSCCCWRSGSGRASSESWRISPARAS